MLCVMNKRLYFGLISQRKIVPESCCLFSCNFAILSRAAMFFLLPTLPTKLYLFSLFLLTLTFKMLTVESEMQLLSF